MSQFLRENHSALIEKVWKNSNFFEKIDIILEDFVEVTFCTYWLDEQARANTREINAINRQVLRANHQVIDGKIPG